ncbi:MAG: hypothetical protein K8R76_07595 [Candidatus Aegiribacteria sp.]|nr:hypothetical protein [Candidatus Aegiribacteria sp.]
MITPDLINILKQQLSETAEHIVPIDSESAASAARDLQKSLFNVVAREVLPRLSNVDFRDLLKKLDISPSDLIFITSGVSTHDKPFQATWSSYFLANQDIFWLPGNDVGLFDETLSWVIITGDDGQTFLSQLVKTS